MKLSLSFLASLKIKLVYGKNGSGKSTISEGVKAAADNEASTEINASFIDENQQELALSEIKDNVFVFNENYIDKNVKIDDDGLGTIILFGGQTDIQTQIDKCQVELEKAQEEYTKADENCKQYAIISNPISPQYHWHRIQNTLKKNGGWAERDSKLKGNRRNSSVTDEIILEICALTPSQTAEELQKALEEKQDLYNKLSGGTNT